VEQQGFADGCKINTHFTKCTSSKFFFRSKNYIKYLYRDAEVLIAAKLVSLSGFCFHYVGL